MGNLKKFYINGDWVTPNSETEFPVSNRNPVLLFVIVSLDPPILLAIITFSIDCASTATLPNASGSIEAETTKSETL